MYRIYEGDDFNEVVVVKSKLNEKKSDIKEELVETKKMKPDFEENLFPRTTGGIYKVVHKNKVLLKVIK